MLRRLGGVLGRAVRVVGDQLLGAARAGADLDAAGLQRLGHHALQRDVQQAVLEVRALDDDVVGEDEAALEGAAGDAAIEQLGFRLLAD